MKFILVTLAMLCLVFGCVSNKNQNLEYGVVIGKTIQITRGGMPGRLQGKPGKPIPPSPVPEVKIVFRSEIGTYEVTSDSHGFYSIELPAGNYEIGWLFSWEQIPPKNPFEARILEYLTQEEREITVENGKKYERELPVRILYVD